MVRFLAVSTYKIIAIFRSRTLFNRILSLHCWWKNKGMHCEFCWVYRR